MTRLKSRYNSSSLSCMIPRIAARVLVGSLTGAALFASAPARADYDACMTFCLDEHNFSYCHPVCDGSAGSAGTAGDTESAVPLFTAEKCRTFEEKETALWTWIARDYGPASIMSMPFVDNENAFELDFSLYEDGEYTDYCIGIVTFDDACQLFETEKIECAPEK